MITRTAGVCRVRQASPLANTVADDAGALLVRSGLVSANALEEARARVTRLGGTLGEHLVASGAIRDDDLTEFYCTRLLVPQVNPNALARLTPKIVATIPSDMAIELRAIPVSFDADNNLTVAMSDPSNRRAVDEISFFTGVYVMRAVATQMQLAWCLAHYYGHVTALGQRLLRGSERDSPIKAAIATASPRVPRTKGLTGKVNATRHRAVAPVTGPVDVLRPNSGELDLRPLANVPASSGVARQAPAARRGDPAERIVPGAPGAPAGGLAAGPAASAIGPVPRPAPSTASGAPSAAAVPGGASRSGPATAAGGSSNGGALPPGSTSSSGEARPGGAWLSGSASPPAAAGPRNAAPSGPSSSIDAAVGAGRSGASGLPRSSPASTPAPSPPVPTPVGAASGAAAPRSAPASTPTTPGVPGAPNAGAPGPNADTGRSSAPELPGSSTPTIPGVGGPPIPAGSAGSPSSPAPAASPVVGSVATAASLPAVVGSVPRAAPDAPTVPPVDTDPPARSAGSADNRGDAAGEAETSPDGAPDNARARSVSGEIRVPVRRAQSIRPTLPDPDDDDDEPLIMIENGAPDADASGPRRVPLRRRLVKSDPPELRARAGEVDLKDAQDRTIDADEPRIVVDEDAFAPPTARIDTRAAPREGAAPLTTIDVVDDADTGALIHDRVVDRESQPILLDRQRATPDQFESARPTIPDHQVPSDDDDADTGEIIVMLDTKSQRHRPERNTQVGVPPAPAAARVHHETEPTGVPTTLVHQATDRNADIVDDATRLDLRPAPADGETTSDLLAAPPSPASDADTNPHVIASPPEPAPPQPPALAPAAVVDLQDDDPSGPGTSVMTVAQLDEAIPGRTSEVLPGHLSWHRIDYDPIDDGWGPPGTTIPPPLLGAIPGSESDDDDDEAANAIPMPNIDSSPLMVGPPSLHAAGDSAGGTLTRALEHTTARAIEVIRELERAQSRDQVVEVMIAHLAETHHRAGFLVTRHAASKGAGELGLFAMTPRPAVMPFGTLRLDRPSTLQDVVGTRLPYRGPMHDDASRSFLISILGACPPEILLVPVAVRERVVGVLFGEHRHHHTFDDQLALAARAAGMALERILKAKRG
jgi:hypothetical protein